MCRLATLLLLVAVCACSKNDSKPAAHTTTSAVPASPPATPQDAHEDDRSERCTAFADRVVECNRGGAILNDGEASSARDIAYAVCTKTTDDEAALHYYGDVDRKMTCMRGKGCLDVLVCLTRTDDLAP